MVKTVKNVISCVRQILDREFGLSLPTTFADGVAKYLDLIREWNNFAGLVAPDELGRLDEHVADSLTLLPYLKRGVRHASLLDIGSGAGFPAVPLKLASPTLMATLVERDRRKAAFIQKLYNHISITDVYVDVRDFPHPNHLFPGVGTITARAVEKPIRILKAILDRLPSDARFLCQSNAITRHSIDTSRFDVHLVNDIFSQESLRRGSLYLVERRA